LESARFDTKFQLYKVDDAQGANPVPIYHKLDGKSSTFYTHFGNYNQWITASGLDTTSVIGANPGDLPAPFVLKAPNNISASESEKLYFQVGTYSIAVPACSSKKEDSTTTYTHYEAIEWDSKTGIVSALITKGGVTSR
jgi:hypothetical protein